MIQDELNLPAEPDAPKTNTSKKDLTVAAQKANDAADLAKRKMQQIEQQNTIEKTGYDPDSLQSDLDAARNNLNQAIATGMMALEGALEEAQSSGHHLAYSAVSELLNAISSANAQLLECHFTGKKVRKPYDRDGKLAQQYTTEGGGTTNITNQSVFVGTTKELQEIIQRLNVVKPTDPTETPVDKHDQYARIINPSPEMLIKEKEKEKEDE